MTLKEIAIELLEKYEASENVAICEYSTNINKDMDLLEKEVKKYRRMIENADRKTEPTISKMEQVEPQTCSFSDCDNFKNPDYERCIECKRKQIKLKTEQTERSSE